MQVIEKSLLAQLVGGSIDDTIDDTGGGGGGGGDGGGWGDGDGWGDGGGWDQSASYDIYAVGIENGQEAVVRITGVAPVFENEPPVADYGPGEAPWEGAYLGAWVVPGAPSYEHTAFDGALIANTGRLAGTAAAVFIEGALTGAGVGSPAGPIGAVGGIVVGGFAAYGAYYLLQSDHPVGHFVSAPTGGSNVPHATP